MLFFRCFLLITLLLTLSSCAIFAPQEAKQTQQPGDFILAQIGPEQSNEEIREVLQAISPSATQSYLLKNEQTSIAFVRALIEQRGDVLLTIEKKSQADDAEIEPWITSALLLFPIDAYKLTNEFILTDSIPLETIETAALTSGLDPSSLFPPTSATNESHRLTPLIHSLSITLFDQQENISNTVDYREAGSNEWSEAYPLQWDPVNYSLSGSIVRLKENTTYEIKVELTQNNETVSISTYSVTTRPNTPIVDESLIYKLSDIYSGGQLDLEALGISGTESGWAKIIGDGETIRVSNDYDYAVNLGETSYVMLEGIKTEGGRLHGIYAYKAHHIWIKDCEVSQWGRVASDFRDGVGYENAESTRPINYDAGIYLNRSGVTVVEGCEIHSPNGTANHWGYGHPYGPTAILTNTQHPISEFQGQYIIRNNRLYGSDEHRFNDAIESRSNGRVFGGFARDSAIYNNYIAYANDDLIELDGGQQNVLVYDNTFEQGFTAISAIPNMIGPSYIFHNNIDNLGDVRGSTYTAIKLGGLFSAPAGVVNIFENKIFGKNNGIGAARFKNDRTFWTNAINNVIVSSFHNPNGYVGLGVVDRGLYEGSRYVNNVINNLETDTPQYLLLEEYNQLHPLSTDPNFSRRAKQTSSEPLYLSVNEGNLIPGFSRITDSAMTHPTNALTFDFINAEFSSFSNQNKTDVAYVSDDNTTVFLEGNTWVSTPINYTITKNTSVSIDYSVTNTAELVGMAFETDNRVSRQRTFNFFGSEKGGVLDFKTNSSEGNVTIPIGEYLNGEISSLVFILDKDRDDGVLSKARFGNIVFTEQASSEASMENNTDEAGVFIVIGRNASE